jgi:hypothetical protein
VNANTGYDNVFHRDDNNHSKHRDQLGTPGGIAVFMVHTSKQYLQKACLSFAIEPTAGSKREMYVAYQIDINRCLEALWDETK